MVARTPLYRPEGFLDSSKVALNPRTGYLVEWQWSNLNPEDFSVDGGGAIYHHCPQGKTWSEVVRHGEEAGVYFEEGEKVVASKAGRTRVRSDGGRRYTSSYTGRQKLRKGKYRNKKYRNSKRRRSNALTKRPARQQKAFQRKRRSVEKGHVDRFVCDWCDEPHVAKIYRDPQRRYSCDACGKCFRGRRLTGCVCETCAHQGNRCAFCEKCEEQLGPWSPDWRLTLSHESHPERCRCKKCALGLPPPQKTAAQMPFFFPLCHGLLGHFEWKSYGLVWVDWITNDEN